MQTNTTPIHYPTQVVTPQELPKLCRKLPKSWKKAAGLLRHKRKALEHHLQGVRLEWDKLS